MAAENRRTQPADIAGPVGPVVRPGPAAAAAAADIAVPSDPVPNEKRPQPGPMPTEGDGVRDEGWRALRDVRSGRVDTDEAGRDAQRDEAPPGTPTRRRAGT